MWAGFRSENCNDAVGRRNSDWNDTKNKLLGAFEGVIKADLENVKKDIRSDSQVLEVTEQSN